jgi:hypothetical protein
MHRLFKPSLQIARPMPVFIDFAPLKTVGQW